MRCSIIGWAALALLPAAAAGQGANPAIGANRVAEPLRWHGPAAVGGRFDGVALGGADLRHADFRGASLVEARLEFVRLDAADFGAADLSYATLLPNSAVQANFTRAVLARVTGNGANFDGAILGVSRAHGANFAGASFVGAYLADADLTGASFAFANLTDANLAGGRARRERHGRVGRRKVPASASEGRLPGGNGGHGRVTAGRGALAAYAAAPSFESVSGLRITDFCRAGGAP